MTTEEKLNRFLETSVTDAMQQSTEIIEKYSAALETEFEGYKNSIDSQIEMQLKAETNKIRILTNRELAEKQIEIKRKISKKQEALKEQIFDEVKSKLEVFKSTPDYPALLEKQIKKAIEFAENDEITIYIDPEDSKLLDSLKKATGAELIISESSFNGGTKAIIPAKNILIDNSFKNKLAEANESFTFYGGNING